MEATGRTRSRSGSGGSKRYKKLSKEQLLLTIKKKKECNAKAQSIVESMLDPVDDSSDFLLKIKDINQCHYQDIIEERALLKLCGYPLCNEKLTEIPTKQYHISTKTNRVYDITERKNFCTNSCFKASNYLKEQMLTSPLWLREQEIIPEFKLLDINKD
ncbi:unnamed protein product [Hermetia illucens]|uniref:RNA polymerase II subunit B1 CTD phosphatase RPAP2 homolog n=1 Tax=Hermetia illucens TaxID=343691 RepID=A0A7R8YNY1_HERIL|nr:putative RNA polymerase II subunit B1 CTD phosphatase RPAP2 homolog [Hermetia illucens]CAD7079726.1 unnamed protein product [Hermetia illucens]